MLGFRDLGKLYRRSSLFPKEDMANKCHKILTE